MPPLSDLDLLSHMAAGNVKAFETLFHRYYSTLCQYAYKFVKHQEVAEEIVSGLFAQIWQKRNELHITSAVRSYLFTSVKHASFNYLKSQYARFPFQSENLENQHLQALSPDDELSYQELQTILQHGIQALPERCRIIFSLSRNAGLSYEEIAAELGISKKTVKAQMGIALHKLRLYMDQHWDKMLVVLVNIF
ncbi:RNA polymerase sigma-70 factor [Rhodocytophaga rosea]|uniref:RNA polymerase sigma-70 factor n=1 Tax=Rhodocytophaga rosea TaxID=2704465 RepID=A0A6C0GT95_9BACT|nr:RNA polymerase sigma-70 factor [Rhodocytophaga rosea]QHT71391.1 RNA polymerase sigma-70 factor [Rhodocytophaga rosea]